MRFSLLLTCAVAAGLALPPTSVAQAPQVTKVSANTNISNYLLGNPAASKNQLLYLPADLAGATAGTINRVYFRRGTASMSGVALSDFTIKLGHTSNTTFVPATEFYTGLQTVLNQATYNPGAGAAGEWISIPLTSAFTYDPAKTLIVETSFTASTATYVYTDGDPHSGANAGKKLFSASATAITGTTTSSVWQHFGFDLGPVGVRDDAAIGASLSIFPQPATTELHLSWPAAPAGPITLSLYDAQGRRVREQQTSAELVRLGYSALPTAELAAGTYSLVVAVADGSRFVRPVVVTQ